MNQRSAARLVTAVTAAAAAVLATSGAAAYAKPPSGGGSTTGTTISGTPYDQAKLAQQSAFFVGTTALSASAGAGAGSTALPGQVPSSELPKTPDVGDNASSNAPVASSLSRKYLHKVSSVGSAPTVSGETVAGATAGLTSVPGLNAYNEGVTHPLGQGGSLPGLDVEPPDQGLCAGNGSVLELNNMVAEAFSGSSLKAQGAASLESLFATPEVFGAGGDGSYSVQGDPRCFYDPSSGRWFASQIWLDLNAASSTDPYAKEFGAAGTFVAVSQKSDPVGKWNVYFVPDLNNTTGTAGCTQATGSNPCFGDQPLLNVDGASVQISTNEYSIYGYSPAGAANLYFLSKAQLLSGSAKVAVHWAPVGTDVMPPSYDNPYGYPWYSIAPAQVPNGRYLTANHGTSYALSSLDLASTGDTHIAEWAFTNTDNADSSKPIDIYEALLNSGAYAFAPYNAAQRSGPTPLGDNWNALNGAKNNNPLPEGQIATNDDRMTTVAYDPSNGALIGGLNTAVNQTTNPTQTQPLTGVAYFVVTPAGSSTSGLVPSAVATGYISPSGANAVFPAVAITSSGSGVMTYTLTGSGYYPSTAYSTVAAGDQVGSTVHVAAAGLGPQDGFTEYQSYGSPYYRPRWGDYSAAVVQTTAGGTQVVDFASEMIGQSCTDKQFAADFTCGKTRDLFANWGTSVNQLTP